jgi:hypothetical protein
MLYWPTKRPEEVNDYGCDWGSALSAEGAVSLTASTWVVEQGNVTTSAPTHTATTTSVRITGGSLGEHVIRNIITTNLGQTLSKRCFIRVA